MTKAILEILASAFGWIAAKGLDYFFGKWVAYFQIAWEIHASKRALDGFRDGMAQAKKDMPEKYDAWKNWRKSTPEGLSVSPQDKTSQ